MIFRIFCISSADDGLFSQFSARRLQAKPCFSQFLMKNHERRAVFIVFCSSLASETLFFAFSAFRLRATNDFQHFLTFPRGGKSIFADFLFSQGWDGHFLPFFWFSQVWERRLSLFFSLPNLGKVFSADFRCLFPHILPTSRDIKEQCLLLPHYMQAIATVHSAHLLKHQTLQKNAVGCFRHQVSH